MSLPPARIGTPTRLRRSAYPIEIVVGQRRLEPPKPIASSSRATRSAEVRSYRCSPSCIIAMPDPPWAA